MPQAVEICPGAYHINVVRFTRLTAAGVAATGPSAAWVTDSLTTLTIEPEVEEGDERIVRNGRGNVCLSAKDPDIITRYTLGLEKCRIEWGLSEMLAGHALIMDASTIPVPIGLSFRSPSAAEPVGVAMEAWADTWIGGGPPADPAHRYLKWQFPKTQWRDGAITLENDFSAPGFEGTSQVNAAYGAGPWTGNINVGEAGGVYLVGTMPTPTCGYVANGV